MLLAISYDCNKMYISQTISGIFLKVKIPSWQDNISNVVEHILLKQWVKCRNEPIKSQKWLTCNISTLYPCIIQQTGSEKTQTYQVEFVILS